MISISSHRLPFTLDGTQFAVGCDSDHYVRFKYANREKGRPSKTSPSQGRNVRITSYFTKYYMRMGPSGPLADHLYVEAEDNMEENVPDVLEEPEGRLLYERNNHFLRPWLRNSNAQRN